MSNGERMYFSVSVLGAVLLSGGLFLVVIGKSLAVRGEDRNDWLHNWFSSFWFFRFQAGVREVAEQASGRVRSHRGGGLFYIMRPVRTNMIS